MSIGIGIFATDLMEIFEHYKRAFDATLICIANGSQNELIHLEMDIMGNKIWVQPCGINERSLKGNATILGLSFQNKEMLMKAYDVLKEDCVVDSGLKEHPWCPLQGIITDKFGVIWCIGL